MAQNGMAKTNRASPRLLLLGTTALLPLGLPAPVQAQAPNAMPTGGQVTAGQALIQQQGTRTQITQGSDRAVIDWQRFDVGRDATVNFTQPSQNAWTLNRVNTPDPSMIAGRITANGGVAIVNPSGVVFAEGAQVNVGSLVASAAGITNQNFMAGRMVFDGTPNPGARVENRGEITVAERGLAALVAPGAANQGAIRARLGTAIVAGAETYRLDLAGDGLLSIEVTQAVRQRPDGGTALVTNSGVIAAEGGQVILTAQAASGLVEQVVRNTGQVTGARVAIEGRGGEVAIAGGAITAPGGRVDITAPGAGVTVAAGARVSASGAAGGGRVQVGGNGTARTRVEGRVAARGTGPAARGGRVAVQATQAVTLAAGAALDASGSAGGGEALVGTTGLGRAQEMARETRLEAGATVRADAAVQGDGGVVVVNSAERTAMAAQLSARGGPQGGNGGFVEVSGMRGLTLNLLAVDVGAGPGGAPGTLLIDPVSIIVRDTAATPPGETDGALVGGGFTTDGTGDDPSAAIIAPADIAAFVGNVTLEAQDSLTVASAITKVNGSLTLRVTGAGGAGITVSAPINVLPGLLTLTSNSALTLNADVAGAAGVHLNVAGSIGGTGGVQTPGVLRLRGFDGTDASGVQGLNLQGANAVGALDLIGSAATVTFTQADALTVSRGQVGADGTLTLGSDGLISGGNITAGDLVIRGAGLANTAAGGLSTTAGMDVARLDARVSGGVLEFAQTAALRVERAHNPGGVVRLGSDGLIQGRGEIVASELVIRGSSLAADSRAGQLTIPGNGSAIATLDARTADDQLAYEQIGGFSVTQADAGTGDVWLFSRGSISGGGVRGNELRIRNSFLGGLGSGAIDLTGPGNAIASLDVAVSGDGENLTFAQQGGFTVERATASQGTVTLGSDGVITGSSFGSPLFVIRGAALGDSRAGGLDFRSQGAVEVALDARTNDAALTWAQTPSLTIIQADAGTGHVTLGSDGIISGGGVVGGTLTIRNATLTLATGRAGGLNLTGTNAITTLDARTDNAALTFAQVGAFGVTQADAGTGNVTLGSDGIISGGGVAGGTLAIRDAALDLTDGRAGGLDITGTNAIATLDARTDGAALTYRQETGFAVLQANARSGAGGGTGDTGGAVELVATNADSTLVVRADGEVQGGNIRLEAGAELSLLGPVLSVAPVLEVTQGHITLATTEADGRIVQGAGGTVTAADDRSIVMTADALTLAANMTAGASGLVEFNRLSPGRITIGPGGPGATAFDPADLASFLGTGHLRLVASDAVQVLADLTRATGELTLRATSATGTTIAVDAAVNTGANPVNLETPGAILGTGVITTGIVVARGDGDPLSRAGSVNLTGDNQAERLNARTDGGDIEFRNAADLRVTRIDALGGAVGITLAGAGLLLEVANDISAGQLTMLADNMAIATGAPALIVPGGAVRLLPFTAGRAITLGGEVAGTLSLSTAELAAIGGAGLDGTTDPATVLRIGAGRSGDIRAGDVTVAGDVELGGRVLALELFSGGDLTGAGAITVGDFGAVAARDLMLDGANAVGRLAAITDTTLVNGEALGLVSLWGGTRNADPLGLTPAREADRLEFRNTAPALTVAGSVLASGTGGLVLTQTADLTVNANRWIVAEAGTLQVNVTGSLTNNGTLVAAPIALNAGGPDSHVLAGGGTNNGTIALGLDATPAPDGTRIAGLTTNNGLMVARTITGITDNAGALITGTGIAGQFGTVFVGDRTVAGALVNTGTIIGDVTADSIENQAGGRILGGTIRATAGDIANAGVMWGTAIEAQGSVLQNGGSMGAGGGTATAEFSLTSAEARTGALTGGAAPATPPATVTETLGATATIRAETGDITQAGGTWVAAPDSVSLPGGGTLHFIAEAGDITQTGGTLTAPGITARAEGLIRLDQAGNSFARIGVSPGSLPAFPDAPAMGAFGIGTATGEVRLTTQATALGATTLTVEAGGGLRAGSDALLRVEGGGLVVDAPFRVGAARSLTLVADDMALNAVAGGMTLVAPGGTVRLLALTAGRAITLGTEVAGSLSLTSAELARIGGTGAGGAADAAQRLRIGEDAGSAIAITGDVLLRQDVSPTGAASLTDAIGGARVAALELVSGAGITQDSGTRLHVAGLAARALGGEVLLHDGAAPGAASGNAIDRIIAGTEPGTPLTPGAARTQDGLRASGNLTLSTWRSLTVEAPVTAGGDAVLRVAPGAGPGPAGVLAANSAITAGNGRALTLIADDMALGAVAGGMTLVVPGGAVRLMPFTAGHGVTLGSEVAGTLSLTTTELQRIGGTGADGTTDPTSVLRIGALDGTTVGDIAVPGAVDLLDRVRALELYAGGSITGSGVILVRDLGAVAGRDLVLDGDNTVRRLAPLTDAGTLNGVAPNMISLWGGTRNSDPQGLAPARQPDRLEFRFVDSALSVDGSVLASGSGGLSLSGPSAVIEIAQDRWVTAEAGTVSVLGMSVTNRGAIYAQDLSGGRVQSTLMGSVDNYGTIILGCGCSSADTSVIDAVHGLRNQGLLVAGSVLVGRGLVINVAGAELRAHRINASDGITNAGLLAAGETFGSLTNAGTVVAGSVRGGFTNHSLLAATEVLDWTVRNQGLVVTQNVTVSSLVNEAGARIESGTGQVAFTLALPDARAAALAGTPAPSGGALALGTTRGGDLALQTTQGGLSNAGTIEADGSARLAAAGDLALTAGSVRAGGALELSAGQDVLQSGGSLVAGGALRLAAGRDALQTGGTAQAASLGDAGTALTIGRDLDWRVTTPEVFAITAGRGLDLRAAGGAVALRGNLQATGGDLALAVPDGTLSLDPGVSVIAGGAVVMETGGALLAPQATLSAGGAMTLTAGTGLSLSGGGVTAGQSLGLAAGAGNVSLRDVVARAGAGGITLASPGAVSLRNSTVTAAQGLDLQAAGDVVVNPSTLAAGGAMRLSAGGALDVTGGAMQAGLGLLLRAGGDMRLSGVALGASTSPAATPAGFQPLRLEAGGGMSVMNGTLRAERAELVAGGSLTTAGSGFAIGTGLLLAAPGGIGQAGEAPTGISGLDTRRAPLVILDTRRNIALVRLPDALTPATTDQPGASATNQPWQVAGTLNQAGQLIFGVDDGRPATPSSAPAGNIAFNMNAGGLPVFVLIDGGTATGRLEAGRLGVFGRPGTPLATGRAFEVLGELGGIGGVGPARLGQLAGDRRGLGPDPAGLSQYRFNDCVISTVNCVAPVSFTLPPVPQVNTLVLTSPLPSLDESDVLLPNVADEDY
ncbi:MAG TPA: filamentous hemagglutinin N-terminal domain-containing protein [Roseococcus sp.]|jgi:filamentous hemagglutinin family protein|nr:filamentous hemagglutinin N-terminal domain-containing protein [Roseococcus sp.]